MVEAIWVMGLYDSLIHFTVFLILINLSVIVAIPMFEIIQNIPEFPVSIVFDMLCLMGKVLFA